MTGEEVLREDAEQVLRRATVNGLSSLVLSPVALYPSSELLRRLTHEHELRRLLRSTWSAKPMDLSLEHGRCRLVLADPGGELLSGLMGRPWALEPFLRVAIGITSALAGVHARGLIHKDIQPANLLVDVAEGQAWVTGFGIASRLPRSRATAEAADAIEGTLAYMAPEQTGRMNRSLDARSDLYALGVTLYEMLTGALPFMASDPLEWVHCHIAKAPVSPALRVPEVPEAVAAIVMRLLAKAAEERYQTAAGVEADLRHCLAAWSAGGRVDGFALGANDMSAQLLIPEKLYGRQRDVATLLDAFDGVVSEATLRVVLVSGYSGVGKSSVVNELHGALVPPRGLFAAGKFDQHKRDIPYATLAQALQSLVRQVLEASEPALAAWRLALCEAVGPSGQLMVNLIPELELVIGKQPPVAELSSQEARHRFQRVFTRCLAVFAQPEHPLALFLDDLQWVDAATLRLLEHLTQHREVGHLLIIGAYRDNEVDAAHPLARTLAALRALPVPPREIQLQPLAREHVGELVAEALRCPLATAWPVAELVHEKTAGNPFFAIQFLTALADEGLLTMDPTLHAWRWDLPRMRAKGYTDNIVDLMIDKLRRLPAEVRAVLEQLACLGNGAPVATLGLVLGTSADDLDASLWEAARAGLVHHRDGFCAFLHDRIQEAAYALIAPEARAPIHLRIGRLLVEHAPGERLEENIFEIVGQLNRGAEGLVSAAERRWLAELNRVASQRAMASTAHASALAYATSGRALLDESCWAEHHALTFALEFQQAECEFLTRALGAAEARLPELVARARSLPDLAAVTCLAMPLFMTLDRSDSAVEACLAYLARVGIHWRPRPGEALVRAEYARLTEQLGTRSIERLLELPLLADADQRATLEVLVTAAPAVMWSDEGLFRLILGRMANLSLEHGNCDASCLAYELLGMVLGPAFGDYEAAYRFGQLGFDLVEKRGLDRFKARVHICFGSLIIPWARDLRGGQALVRDAFAIAMQCGDLNYAAYGVNLLVSNLLASGTPLDEVQREAESGLAFTRKTGFGLVSNFFIAQLRLIRGLRGLPPEYQQGQVGPDAERAFEQLLTSNSRHASALFFYLVRTLQERFHADDFEAALAAALPAEGLLWTVPSLIESAEFHFFAALTRAACQRSAPNGEHLGALRKHHAQLSSWAEICPANFEGRVCLVAAELAALEDRQLDAEHLYERAIAHAREHSWVHNDAIANELAARFQLARGFETFARAYLKSARHAYLRWGATGKVQLLEQTFPRLLEERDARRSPTASAATPVEQLDLATVSKVSQAISSEIDLDRLLERLMVIAVENAGASRGLLVLPWKGEPRIEAEATTRDERVSVRLPRGPVDAQALPLSVFRYVSRTQEMVIIDDACLPNRFSGDGYIAARRSRSILCLPLVKGGQPTGVLYLENELAPFVFTPSRVALLTLIAGQAAVSLANAQLYTELRQADAYLATAQRLSHTGSFAWSTASGMVTWSRETYHIFGYDPAEVPTIEMWAARIHPDDLPRSREDIRIAARAGEDWERQYRLLMPDGAIKHVSLVANAVKDETGAIGYVGAVMDVTEHRRATAALESAILEVNRSEAVLAGEKRLLEMLAKGSSFGLIIDVFCRLVEQLCAGSRCSVLLVDRDGKRLRHAAAPNLPPAYNEMVDGIEIGPYAGSCGSAAFLRQWVVVADVTLDERWVAYREVALAHGIRACWSMPVFSHEGAVLGTFALYFSEPRVPDARERTLVEQLTHLASIAIVRKRGDDALRRSESYLAEAQKISRTGSFAWNAQSGDMFWSDETYRIAGVDRSTLPSLELMFEQVHPDDRAPVKAAIDRAMNGEGDIDLEYRLITRAGNLEHVQLLGRAMRDTSGSVELVGATMDVTARRRAADELQHAQAALAHVSRVTMLGELAASMAHEINQPLTAIVADASACINWLSATPPVMGELHEALAAIVQDGKRAGDVLTRIRSLLSRSAVARERCDLSAVIAHVLPLTRSELARQGTILEVELAREMPPIAADPVELQQVVLNLVLNAAEASRDVAAERRRISVRSFVEQDTNGAVVVCAVEDAGAGFAVSDPSRLFDAFYTTKPSGLGMGLSISRSIIERHSGRLWATPNAGHGVTFSFAIPVTR